MLLFVIYSNSHRNYTEPSTKAAVMGRCTVCTTSKSTCTVRIIFWGGGEGRVGRSCLCFFLLFPLKQLGLGEHGGKF